MIASNGPSSYDTHASCVHTSSSIASCRHKSRIRATARGRLPAVRRCMQASSPSSPSMARRCEIGVRAASLEGVPSSSLGGAPTTTRGISGAARKNWVCGSMCVCMKYICGRRRLRTKRSECVCLGARREVTCMLYQCFLLAHSTVTLSAAESRFWSAVLCGALDQSGS